MNEPEPDRCPHCGSVDLEESKGYVGELVLYCKSCRLIVWEDSDDAIRRVI